MHIQDEGQTQQRQDSNGRTAKTVLCRRELMAEDFYTCGHDQVAVAMRTVHLDVNQGT